MNYVKAIIIGIAMALVLLGTKYFTSISYEKQLTAKQNVIDTLKSRMASLETFRDTIYVKGDTILVRKKKSDSIGVSVLLTESIDTTTFNYDSTVIVSVIRNKGEKNLQIYAIALTTELLRIDTIKIKEPFLVEIPAPVEIKLAWYNRFSYGFITGVVSAVGIVYVVSEVKR